MEERIVLAGVFSIVQYPEANFIFPFIIGIELNVNTWTTLVTIIAGGLSGKFQA